jgi:hypothetical protein
MSYFHALFAFCLSKKEKHQVEVSANGLSAVLAVELLVCPGEKDGEVQ